MRWRVPPQISSEHPGSSAVIAAVGESFNAMGYAGYNHLNPMVRALRLVDESGAAVAPNERSIQQGKYPLSRDLYLYVNLPPGESLPPVEQAFLTLYLFRRGSANCQSSWLCAAAQSPA